MRISTVEWCLLIRGKYVSFQRDGREDLINGFVLSPLGRKDTTGDQIADDGAVGERENGVPLCGCLRSEIRRYRVTYSRYLDETVCKAEVVGLEFGGVREELFRS